MDHKLLYVNAYVGIVSVCEQLWYVYCAPDCSDRSLIYVPVMSLCLLQPVCVGSCTETALQRRHAACMLICGLSTVCIHLSYTLNAALISLQR